MGEGDSDFYKRKLPGKSAEAPKPIVSTKGATFGGEIPVIQPVATIKHDDSCCGGTGGSCGCSH